MKNSVKKLKNACNEAKNCLSRRRVLFCGFLRSKSFSCFSSVLLSRQAIIPRSGNPPVLFACPFRRRVSRQKEQKHLGIKKLGGIIRVGSGRLRRGHKAFNLFNSGLKPGWSVRLIPTLKGGVTLKQIIFSLCLCVSVVKSFCLWLFIGRCGLVVPPIAAHFVLIAILNK